jgi:peptide deformylase
MAVREILIYPDHRLKEVCASVDDLNTVKSVVEDLIDTMNAGPPRTTGIAAPQIGSMVRIVIVDSSRSPKHPEGHGLMVLVNPVIVEHSGSQVFREGCLSIPDYTANIRRAESIVVKALDQNLTPIEISADGFEAVVVQHEMDHLDGMLFLDRITDIKADLFRRKNK